MTQFPVGHISPETGQDYQNVLLCIQHVGNLYVLT